ncbi:hypothetical protein ACQPU1_17785 [Clostridium paraputrificum]|uniref:hypothetical protein n=1 Tax=Clostridium paraputrificum TaxID=29363 RepID=UPI003D343ED6
MNFEIVKMVIGILGMILSLVYIIKLIRTPIEDNKAYVLTKGRNTDNDSVLTTGRFGAKKEGATGSFKGINTITRDEKDIKLEEVEDSNTELLEDFTELLDEATELLDDNSLKQDM